MVANGSPDRPFFFVQHRVYPNTVEVPSLSQLAYPRASGIDRSKADETSAQCLIMSVWPHDIVFERLDARLNKSIAPDWAARI